MSSTGVKEDVGVLDQGYAFLWGSMTDDGHPALSEYSQGLTILRQTKVYLNKADNQKQKEEEEKGEGEEERKK